MIALPRLGLGMAAPATLGPDTSDEAVVALVKRARARGIDWFDTSPLYGSGRSEDLLGRAKPEAHISTKAGYVLTAPWGTNAPGDSRVQDFGTTAIEESVAASLKRLGRDRVDLVMLHDPDKYLDMVADQAFPALQRLKDQGVIGAIGIGINRPETALTLLARIPLDAVLIAGRLTLLDWSAALELLPACRAKGVAIIAAGVLNSGILGGQARFHYQPPLPEISARVAQLSAICADHGTTLKAAAFHYPARHVGVSMTLIGARTIVELDETLDLLEMPLPEALWRDLENAGVGR